jgi:predicted AAA+ superfamily ATPase
MKRNIEKHLLEWKQDASRKVLLLRGARQVGKTYTMRELGKTFPHFLEANFEEQPGIKLFFQNSLAPADICEKLSGFFGVPIKPGETLVFLDEIQACPEALRSLRFFHEKMPGLHVAAAGSLLEFALAEIPSFGVGRISSLYMYPMTFNECIREWEGEKLLELLQKAGPENPLDDTLHGKVLDKFRLYLILGGMPETVKTYAASRDLRACQAVIDDITAGFKDDFAKYKKRMPAAILMETFQAAAYQAGGKFKWSRISPEISAHTAKTALHLLQTAGLLYKVNHTAARGIPLGAQADPAKFKVILFDLGIHQRLLGLDLAGHLIAGFPDLVNKGSLAEVFAGLEYFANLPPRQPPQLHYWHREAKSSNAEVDYVIQDNERIIPVEVKSGVKGGMRSMNLFLKERNLPVGIRLSQENFGQFDNIRIMPAYAAGRLSAGGW